MGDIVYPSNDFKFDNITLANPNGLQGGCYFTKLLNDNNPLYIQTTSCKTKNGIVNTTKKSYCDLQFNNNDNIIVSWFENLEKTI